MPVLVVAGAEDEKFAATAQEMAAHIGDNATVAIVPNAAHAVPFEAPEAFRAVLTDWLRASGGR
jgi:2-succinyl-6-hydroxy-2,4-cyclohexadiene-1-carboxylate synthase